MKSAIFALVAILVSAIGQTASTEEQVATGVVDGKKIHIYSDFTWVYAVKSDSACETIAKNLEFCGDKNLWTRTVAATAELAAQYSYDDRHYAIIIAEDLGDADGLTLEFMRSAAIQNAAAGASVQPEDVTIFDSSDRLFDGFNASQIVYGIEMEGVNVVYSNVIVSKNTETFQLIVYAVGSTYTDTHQQIMDEFLAGIEVK